MDRANPWVAIVGLLVLLAGLAWLLVGYEAGKAERGKRHKLHLALWIAAYLTGGAMLVGFGVWLG